MSTSTRTATVKSADPAQDAPNPADQPQATVATRQYAPDKGWAEGDAAPTDLYVEVAPDGSAAGKPTTTAPKGKYAQQLAVKGQPVTAAVLASIAAAGA